MSVKWKLAFRLREHSNYLKLVYYKHITLLPFDIRDEENAWILPAVADYIKYKKSNCYNTLVELML